MMVGHNPEIDMEAALENETAVPKAYATPLPESYSRSLQALVYNLLQTDRENRYTAAEVVKYGDAGFKTYETRMKVFDRYSFRTTADRDDRPDLSL